MTNETFEQMAQGITDEVFSTLPHPGELAQFATRLRAEWLKQCAVGFEEAKYDWEANDDWQFADRDAERKFFFQACAASQQQRIAELEARLNQIGDFAHDKSTGPAIPDALWEVRALAYELL